MALVDSRLNGMAGAGQAEKHAAMCRRGIEEGRQISSGFSHAALVTNAARLNLGLSESARAVADGGEAEAVEDSGFIAVPTETRSASPVPDQEQNAGRPLAAFDPSLVENAYYAALDRAGGEGSNPLDYMPPKKPDSFKDRYLFPILTATEKQRLNRLWWLTNGIESDINLVDHLNSLVSLLKDSTGYDMAILGLLDNDAYVRIAADGCPLAVVPRRESTCSHTVLQKPGTVFSVPDMQSDWRFQESPNVVVDGGLRSYAGTQLCYRQSESEEPVILGSLCVANTEAVPPLTQLQQKSMIRISAAIMHALASRARIVRQGAQKEMNERLTTLASQAGEPSKIIEKSLGAIQETFPGCRVSLERVGKDRKLSLGGGGRLSVDDFQQYLWENDDFIENWIVTRNHESSIDNVQSETIRAIAVPVDDSRYLLVQTADLRHVFDEIDALFVRSCGMLLSNALQEGLLQRALQAKANFLRDVQHSLRTSLNGILSASEMLLDEAATKSILDAFPFDSPSSSTGQSPRLHRQSIQPTSANAIAGGVSPAAAIGSYESLLNIIDSSGRNLVNIINNLLDLDSTNTAITPKLGPCNLYDLEEEVIELAMQGSSRSKIARVTLISDNEIPDHTDTLMTDPILLRQILAILVQNALDATDSGSVIISIYLDQGGSLVVDVVDTGRGIAEADRKRIFDPFVKVNAFSQSAGLGLSFAARYAEALHATVKLVTSEVGEGSHFRLHLAKPVLACARAQPHGVLSALPKWSYSSTPQGGVQPENVTMKHLCRILETLGCKRKAKESATFIVSQVDMELSASEDPLAGLSKDQIALSLVPAADFRKGAKTSKFDDQGRLIYCGLPLCRNRLLASLAQVQRARADLKSDGTMRRTPSEIDQTLKQSNARALRFLLVDDNAMNLNILQAYCKKRKYDYILASDGQEAYERYVEAQQSGRPISITLLDLQMPICDGIEATTLIRKYEQDSGIDASLIFMVTGQSGEEEKERAAQAGSDGYHVKPLRLKILDELLVTHSFA